jgi:hypothetical protein
MEFIKNLTKPFENTSEFIKERLTSRLASAYAIAWLVYNWRLLFYFINSNADIETKILVIDMFYIDNPNTYLYPLFFAFGYIILYPPLSALADFIWTLFDSFPRRKFKAIIEGRVPLFEEDRVALFSFVNEQTDKANEEIKQKNKEIASLRALLSNSGILNSEIENIDHDNDNDPYDYDSFIDVKALNNENTIYFLRRWVSLKFHLSLENSVHRAEVDKIVLVIQSIAQSHPEPWKIKQLTLNKDGKNQIVPVAIVESIILKLISTGIILPPNFGLRGLSDISSDRVDHDDLFVLSKEGVMQVKEAIAST